jgi:hypothetical protein
MLDFIDWLCGSNGGYGFDPVTHDYSPITYVVGSILGIPFAVLMIFSRANAVCESLRAPFVRVIRGGADPFESYADRKTTRDS